MSLVSLREKLKWKEREEAWIKIENLAKSNPQVRTLFFSLVEEGLILDTAPAEIVIRW